MKKRAAARKTGKAPKAQKHRYQCMRCEKIFTSRNALKVHSKSHLRAVKEMKLLESGTLPVETKLGSEFKGKNKVIVS